MVLMAPALARSRPPPHPPDNEVGPSGIPVSTAFCVSITAGCSSASAVPATSASEILATAMHRPPLDVPATGASAVSATTALGHSGLGPSVVPATSALGIPATATPRSSAVPDTGTLGVPAMDTPWPSSALLRPPRCPLDHGTSTSDVSAPRTSELQAPLSQSSHEAGKADCHNTLGAHGLPKHPALTRGCKEHGPD